MAKQGASARKEEHPIKRKLGGLSDQQWDQFQDGLKELEDKAKANPVPPKGNIWDGGPF